MMTTIDGRIEKNMRNPVEETAARRRQKEPAGSRRYEMRYKMRVRNPSKVAQLDKGGFCSAAVPAAVRGNYKTSTHGQLRSPALLGLSRMYCVIF